MKLGDDFYDRPVHGPYGRIAFARQRLQLRQADFAARVERSRETVSHWESFRTDGRPWARTTRRSSAAIAALVRAELGVEVADDDFFGHEATALDKLTLEVASLRDQVSHLTDDLDSLRKNIRALTTDIVGDYVAVAIEELKGELEPAWLTTEQAAARLGCSPEAVRRRANRGRLESRHQGKRVYISARGIAELAGR